MNNRHPWQLKKSKLWGLFCSYQLNGTANSAYSRKNGPNGLNWQWCLAGNSKTALRILIFSIVMGAYYSFELISIETYMPPKILDIINFSLAVCLCNICNNIYQTIILFLIFLCDFEILNIFWKCVHLFFHHLTCLWHVISQVWIMTKFENYVILV